VNADGSGLKLLTDASGEHPTWSPDGQMIAFASTFTGCRNECPSNIYVVGADGKDRRLLIANGRSPSWRR
jgi:Tol biopolymer transport system component